MDDVAGRLRDDAERGGWWEETHLWIVSDHGHSPVHTHEDLAAVVAATGRRTVAHPWSAGIAPDAAVMVSGNAMAHVYVELDERERAWWPALAARHEPLAEELLARESVDLLLLPHGRRRGARCAARRAARRSSSDAATRYRYARQSGDPLGLGARRRGRRRRSVRRDARRATIRTAIVQIVTLAGSARAGDIILSATPGWDFRARYEPIPHRSAHGALHRDHMMVPLLTNRPPAGTPRRTTDVFASALDALGVAAPARMDGRSFLGARLEARAEAAHAADPAAAT